MCRWETARKMKDILWQQLKASRLLSPRKPSWLLSSWLLRRASIFRAVSHLHIGPTYCGFDLSFLLSAVIAGTVVVLSAHVVVVRYSLANINIVAQTALMVINLINLYINVW